MTVSPYQNLWFSTDQLVRKFKPSLSNTFDVYIKGTFGGVRNDDINFLAYDAVLPGTSYETGQVYGDRQGRIEQYPTRRVYPPVDISFYINQDYNTLQFFEQWMAAISPNYGDVDGSYTKFNYPKSKDQYEKEVVITKFERLFRQPNQRLVENGVYGPPLTYVEYTLRNAYPVNLISVPVSYEGTNILKTTVTFNYDVYNFKRKNDSIGTDENGGEGLGNKSATPGGDSSSTTTAPGATNQVRPNSLLTQAEYNTKYAEGFEQSFRGKNNVPKSFKNQNSQQLLDQYNQTQK